MKSYSAHEIAAMPDWSVLRVSKDLSLEQISNITNIPERKLEAIERHDFEALGTPTFAAGYIRSYAKILKEDAEIFVQVYKDAMVPEPVSSPAITQSLRVVAQRHGNIWQKFSVLHVVGLGIVVWIAIVFMRDDGLIKSVPEVGNAVAESVEPSAGKEPSADTGPLANREPSANRQPSADKMPSATEMPATMENSVKPQAAEVAGADNGTSISQDHTHRLQGDEESSISVALSSSTGPSGANDPLNQAPLSQRLSEQSLASLNNENMSAEVDSAQADAAGPLANDDVLEFSFEEDCWVEVKAADNRVLIAQIKRKGDNLRLFGQAPFNIHLGNARAVNLTLNGAAVKIEPKSGRNTLRFVASR